MQKYGLKCVLGDFSRPDNAGADPGFLDQGFKLAEQGSICAVWPIFPEIPHEN